MSHLPFTLLAYALNSVAVTIDKYLLTKKIPDPLLYVFYISLASLVVLIALPFTHIPTLSTLMFASLYTLLWSLAAFLMFKALSSGPIQRVIPIIGVLTPLILFAVALQTSSIPINQAWAVGFLLLGLVFITLKEQKGKFGGKELALEISSATLFALSYLALRQAYLQQDFVTVLVFSRMILIPLGFLIIAIPDLRGKILGGGKPHLFGQRIPKLFVVGQICGGLAGLLLSFSISLANPALVNSLQGVQYIFILIFSLSLGKKYPEVFKNSYAFIWLLVRWAGVIFILFGLYMLAYPQKQTLPKLGVTYSPTYAVRLNLDPKTTYLKMLDELKVKRVRIPVYWNEVEHFPQKINFASLNFYLNEAQKRGVEVILVIGYKQPRWPECFAPEWVAKLTRENREKRILDLLEKEVLYFKKFPAISTWQVENEPLFGYGICESINHKNLNLLKTEVALVKKLDQRPIIITDSGEMGSLLEPMKLSDKLGISLYRQVWSPYFGIVDYPLPPMYYTLKEAVMRLLAGNGGGQTIISELQSEPWITGGQPTEKAEISEQIKILPVSKLKTYIEYAKETGFEEIYLWGVEWWYFMEKNGHPEYLEYAKELFRYSN